MKIRNGFVSNSSSSSFIIGIGKIVNIDKFKNYCEENAITIGDATSWENVKVVSTSDLLGLYNVHTYKRNDHMIIEIESFTGRSVSIKYDPFIEEPFVIVYVNNNEGDSDFMDGDDYWGDLNYDIDETFFHKTQQALLDIDGVENYQCEYGAGRNG